MHPVLDRVAIHGFTLRGWLLRKGKDYRRLASAARADAGTQGEPTALLWERAAEACDGVLADLEKSTLPERS